MTETIPDDRPQRRREYSGPGSTLGLAALVVIVVGAAIWWSEFRDDAGSGSEDGGDFGVVGLPDDLNPTGKAPAAREGRAAPNFELADLDGGPVRLDQFRGKYVLVNFWASWCGPCRGETPDLQDFYGRVSGRNVTVVGVNQQEPASQARAFVEGFGVTYPVLLDRSGEVSEAYSVGVGGLPASFLIAPDGVIEQVFVGRITAGQLDELEGRLP